MRHSKSYENLDENLFEEGMDANNIDEFVSDVESKGLKTRHKNARKSVEDYLLHKRLRRQYRELFDDEFEESDES